MIVIIPNGRASKDVTAKSAATALAEFPDIVERLRPDLERVLKPRRTKTCGTRLPRRLGRRQVNDEFRFAADIDLPAWAARRVRKRACTVGNSPKSLLEE